MRTPCRGIEALSRQQVPAGGRQSGRGAPDPVGGPGHGRAHRVRETIRAFPSETSAKRTVSSRRGASRYCSMNSRFGRPIAATAAAVSHAGRARSRVATASQAVAMPTASAGSAASQRSARPPSRRNGAQTSGNRPSAATGAARRPYRRRWTASPPNPSHQSGAQKSRPWREPNSARAVGLRDRADERAPGEQASRGQDGERRGAEARPGGGGRCERDRERAQEQRQRSAEVGRVGQQREHGRAVRGQHGDPEGRARVEPRRERPVEQDQREHGGQRRRHRHERRRAREREQRGRQREQRAEQEGLLHPGSAGPSEESASVAATLPRPNEPLMLRSCGWSWQESVTNRFGAGVRCPGVVSR